MLTPLIISRAILSLPMDYVLALTFDLVEIYPISKKISTLRSRLSLSWLFNRGLQKHTRTLEAV